MTDEERRDEEGRPDPLDSTAEEILARGAEAHEDEAEDPERLAREQAEEILRESEERTEHPSTVDPDNEDIERRSSDETADLPEGF